MRPSAYAICCLFANEKILSVERQRMKSKQRYTITAVLLLLASISVIVYSGYKLRENLLIYAEGDKNYEQLQTSLRKLDKKIPSDPDIGSSEAKPLVEIPALSIDFEALKSINADAAAWLYCPDTIIDYPVMRADDYAWYLHHLPDGTLNANGSLFLDFNGSSDFSGKLNIIYGHNMRSGKMFGSLAGYKKQEYFEQHPYMYLYTQQGNYRIDLKYGCTIGAGEWRDRAFMYDLNLDALLSYAAIKTTFESGAEYTDSDRFVVLSTCSYEFDDARYIVIGVLRPEQGSLR